MFTFGCKTLVEGGKEQHINLIIRQHICKLKANTCHVQLSVWAIKVPYVFLLKNFLQHLKVHPPQVGSVVADAASQHLQWIYDQSGLVSTVGDENPEFWKENKCPYFNLANGKLRYDFNIKKFVALGSGLIHSSPVTNGYLKIKIKLTPKN